MRVLALNLRAGGSRKHLDRLLVGTLEHRPDVVVYSEFRAGAAGEVLRSGLRGAGLEHVAWSVAPADNGVLIASRAPFTTLHNPFGLEAEEYPGAVLRARFDAIDVFGVYLPGQDRKRPHLRSLIATAQRYNERGARALCIGDFNSGRNDTDIEINVRTGRTADQFGTADLYEHLERYWTEAWLWMHPGQIDYSWQPFRRDAGYVGRSGWRIDKAFVSAALLPAVRLAEYDHSFRDLRLTDHSALVVDLDEAPPM
jgi:exodeoxyribonuclease III